MASYKFVTLKCALVEEGVLHVELNRPDKLNAMNHQFWVECAGCFDTASDDHAVRAVVVSSNARIFTAGLDITEPGVSFGDDDRDDPGRRMQSLRKEVKLCQAAFNAIEACNKPVIAAVHGACVGGGVDLITACDIRYCTADAWFQIKEVEVGLAADVGTLQRLPKIVGNDSVVRDLCLTARRFDAQEALRLGMVSSILGDKAAAIEAAMGTAKKIASMSPLAVVGTKHHLNYSRDHTVAEGLEYIATWNAAALQSEDLLIAMKASLSKTKATFKPLYASKL